jgi:hypothetical protein
MSWNDDSWKDSYDAWKLASPDDEYDEPCDHEDYEVDILTGRCHCDRCSESWYASDEEINLQIRHEAEYHENMERENRRQWWRDLFQPIRNLTHRLYEWRISRNFEISKGDDDDIPF